MVDKSSIQKSMAWTALVFLLLSSACMPLAQRQEDIEPIIATSIQNVTPTPTFSFHTDLSCWQTKPLQAGNDIEGSLTLGYGSSNFYWDISTFRANSLPFTVDIPSRIAYNSPDGNYIPLELPENNQINLIFSDNYSATLLLFPSENYRFTPILNGKILVEPWDDLLSRPDENKNYQKDVGYTDTYYIYDSKTGSQLEEHSILLPNFTFFFEAGVYGKDISYSPDGHYVLYRSKPSSENGKDVYSLLDLRSNQVKWIVPVSKPTEGAIDEGPAAPTWKPDGSGLTYIWISDNEGKEQNFYNIALDGTVSQITRFEEVFPPGYILAFNPQWSPDGRYMAFKVRKAPYPSEDVEIFVWDDVKKSLLNPCLVVSTPVPLNSIGIDWSFDSEHLVVRLPNWLTPYSTGSAYHKRNFILDVPVKVIYELPDDKAMREYMEITDDAFSYSIGNWLNWEIP